jgi:hypothetical protein
MDFVGCDHSRDRLDRNATYTVAAHLAWAVGHDGGDLQGHGERFCAQPVISQGGVRG